MIKRVSISYELDDNRCHDSLIRRLRQLGADPKLPTLWSLHSSRSVDEIRRDLQAYIDPADRLVVMEITSMSSRNLINSDKSERGAA